MISTNSIKRLSLITVLCLGSGIAAGCSCASKADLDAVRAEAQGSRKVAEQALSTANEAHQTAADADARSRKTEEVVNRSFKKSMHK